MPFQTINILQVCLAVQYSCNCVFSLDFHVYIDFLVFFLGGGGIRDPKIQKLWGCIFSRLSRSFYAPPPENYSGWDSRLTGVCASPLCPSHTTTDSSRGQGVQGPPGPDPGGGKAPPDRHRAHSHTLAGFFLSSIFFCFFFSYFFYFFFFIFILFLKTLSEK